MWFHFFGIAQMGWAAAGSSVLLCFDSKPLHPSPLSPSHGHFPGLNLSYLGVYSVLRGKVIFLSLTSSLLGSPKDLYTQTSLGPDIHCYGFSQHCYADDTQLPVYLFFFPLDEPLSLRQTLKLSLTHIESAALLSLLSCLYPTSLLLYSSALFDVVAHVLGSFGL